jgi:DNA-binding LacI/PurR family transcriptional regulator
MGKKITITDIANRLGISPTTVSFVLNKRSDKGISAETIEQVLRTADELGYKTKHKPKNSGWIRTVFLIRDYDQLNLQTTFFSKLHQYLNKICKKNKIELQFQEFPYNNSQDLIVNFHKISKSGFDVYLSNDPQIIMFLDDLTRSTVLVQAENTVKDIICVHCDDYSGGAKIANYAYESGHRTGGIIYPYTYNQRVQGFIDTFTKLGGKCPDKYRLETSWDFDEVEETVAARTSDDNLPTFFFCFSDSLIFPAIRGLAVNGISVPDDISMIGADNLFWGKYSKPSFTTLELNEELFAEKLVQAIQSAYRKDPTYQVAIPVSIIERESFKKLS